jgi:peptidyl-prolyl cis-trans isomerase C
VINHRKICVLSTVLVLCTQALAIAQEIPQEIPKSPGDPVAATVNGVNVYRSEVLRTFYTTLKGRHESLDAPTRSKMLASILDEVIDQRLVYQYLKMVDKIADEKAVIAEIKNVGKGLEQKGEKWDAYLLEKGYTRATFRRQIAWRLAWQAYLAATITDQLLQEYFTSNAPEYDGSEVRASHILLRDDRASGEQTQKLFKRAVEIRKKITTKQMTFAEAAKKHSDGPSRLQGGDIGYFPRHGVQGEAFSQAAFELRKNAISDPVVTSFGVHLIQATDLKPGKIKWTDIRAKLRRDITRDLFEKIAQKKRVLAKIEFTGAVPHFRN